MVKTCNNTSYQDGTFQVVDAQTSLENSTGNAVVIADDIVPSQDNVYSVGTFSKQWKEEYCKTLITDTVSLSSNNYAIISNTTITYSSPDTLDPTDPPLKPFLTGPSSPFPSAFDGGYDGANGWKIKFPSRGMYLIQFDLSWDTSKFLPIPSGELEFRLTDTVSARFANDTMSNGFMYIIPTPIFSIPLFFNATMPIRFEVHWLCLNTNERLVATIKSNESVFGLQPFQTGDFQLFIDNFNITRLAAYH